MNYQIGDLVYSASFPNLGYGIVLNKLKDDDCFVLFIHWVQHKQSNWNHQKHMSIFKCGEYK